MVSDPYPEDEQHHQPHLISSYCSEEENSITGKFSNIEYKYHIDPRVLGTGHHGSVRECIDRTTGIRYAVKSICKTDPQVKPSGIAREIALLREMKPCSIVIQLVDVFEDAQYVHLVTDLCEGGELFDKICERASNSDNGAVCFAEDETAKIMHQILTAVSCMHKRGIVHRDIKPENILFETAEDDSPVKIIDFGLSRKHYAKLDAPMRTVVGTPYYIAPEVLRRRYDKTCDLWSTGVIAYILLCGYPPFNGANNNQTHKSVLKGRYSFPEEDWKDVSQEAKDFIVRMLQMDPKKRMSVEQALNHPWLVKHNVNTDVLMRQEEEVQERSSVEVVYNETPPRKRNLSVTQPSRMVQPSRTGFTTTRGVCGSPPRRRVRMSMFGL
ncbi:hypothetical protein ACHAXR_003852 [Thalassiosira sp. AJA248-18]